MNFFILQVWHPAFAFGISLTTSDGYKIVYSGDTRPSDQLVETGKHAHLLIHEATFDDVMVVSYYTV